ncbi:MAG TPA: TaqI-like C-terminal specificity domain-containing protein [Planctomycetaceae bacterium]|nr:TaqI-like C-terminal specificity domain-containing protein [Planctomycetaceae bacterium]
MARHQTRTFEDVAQVRVGIKTTADEVFLREEWNSLPAECQPEPELIRPLIRHFDARRWVGPAVCRQSVLYPHAMVSGKRTAVDLSGYPRARAYFERHYERLNRRSYVIDGGRKWYEIWVPHLPDDWQRPKIVFPDISEQPRFFLDATGAVVNGDCYWMTLREGLPSDWLLLMLAVANSTFMTRFYDLAFHNKLYAGRRRYMTQYVSKLPLPPFDAPAVRKILPLAARLVNGEHEDARLEAETDRLVWESFGLVKET